MFKIARNTQRLCQLQSVNALFWACLLIQSVLIVGCDNVPILNTPETPPVQPSACPNWQPGETVTITENTTLPPGCYYQRVSFVIQQSNIQFDCNGAVLNGTGTVHKNADFIPYSESNAPAGVAFSITSLQNKMINDIEVRNCKIKNYVDGVRIKTLLTPETVKQLKTMRDGLALEETLRSYAPQAIQLNNLSISDAHKHGVYVDRYVHHVEITNGVISNSGNSAIYLESGTQQVAIRQMRLEHNGYSSYDRDKRVSLPRLGVARREAIAVDSSAQNLIDSNVLRDNAAGGIFLYKNCYEKYQDAAQMPRLQHSDANRIVHNQFQNEAVGVWLASRQSRDLADFSCGDAVVYSQSGQQFFRDFAQDNLVSGNTFTNVEVGVKVEDDHNQVRNNQFVGDSQTDIQVGSSIRSLLKQPIIDVDLAGNMHQARAQPVVTVLPAEK